MARQTLNKLKEAADKMTLQGLPPVVLCSSRIRLPFRRLTERTLPNLAVLSLNEISADIEIEAVGTVMLD